MDWKIGRGGGECSACKKAFEDREVYYSCIELKPAEIDRDDFCGDCFNGLDEERKQVFWRTRSVVKNPAKKAVNFEAVRALFLKMLTMDELIFKELNYLLALVLIRKKLLRLIDFVTVENKDVMTVQLQKGTPKLHVEVPLLDSEKIDLLRERLSTLLDADLDGEVDVTYLRERVNASSGEPPRADS